MKRIREGLLIIFNRLTNLSRLGGFINPLSHNLTPDKHRDENKNMENDSMATPMEPSVPIGDPMTEPMTEPSPEPAEPMVEPAGDPEVSPEAPKSKALEVADGILMVIFAFALYAEIYSVFLYAWQ